MDGALEKIALARLPSAPPRGLASPSVPVCAPAGSSANQREGMIKAERQANILRELAFPAAMTSAIPIGKDVGPAGFKLYLDRLLKDAGDPVDPVERMMIEQLAMAHHRIAQLHVQVEQARSIEEAKVYSGAAARLTGELRRLALALKAYREPSPKRNFTVVRQQNVAAGSQQIAFVEGTDLPGKVPLQYVGDKQGRDIEHVPQEQFFIGSETCSSGATVSPIEGAVDARRPRASAESGSAEQTMAAFYGAADS